MYQERDGRKTVIRVSVQNLVYDRAQKLDVCIWSKSKNYISNPNNRKVYPRALVTSRQITIKIN